MISPFLKTIWLGFVVISILGGCGQKQEKDTVEVLALGPDLETLGVVPDYVARATEAAGGPDAWMRTKELRCLPLVELYSYFRPGAAERVRLAILERTI
ncbi:MAG: hypothetical protein ACYS19_07050 [Planctomycetota bacterium]|jgi:hypothetical protein